MFLSRQYTCLWILDDILLFKRLFLFILMLRKHTDYLLHNFLYVYACSGQRVIVQDKNEEQGVENVVTIQVGRGGEKCECL